MSLLMHCGGVEVGLEDLTAVPLPRATRTYAPVAHQDLAEGIQKVASDLLVEFSHDSSRYGLARDGNQLFGVHTFKNASTELGLSIAFRNSYDRSMAVGMAFGASVFICDNLALQGNIVVLRKHTSLIGEDLEELIVTNVYRSRMAFKQVVADANGMKEVTVNDDEAYATLGRLFGHRILKPRQLRVAYGQWHRPRHKEFQPRTLWSLYNAATEALKSSPPAAVLERHTQLHALVQDEFLTSKENQYAS